MKLYYPENHYAEKYRNFLFPLLRFYGVGNKSDSNQVLSDDDTTKVFLFVNNIEKADVVLLTMSWNYYVKTNNLNLAEKLIKSAQSYNREVWSVNLGDFGVTLPSYDNLIVFRMGGYRDKLPSNHIGMPVFISPPEKLFPELSLYLNNYEEIPTVGFCGHADNSLINRIKSIFKILIKNTLRTFGFNKQDKEPYLYAPYLRNEILQNLSKSNLLSKNFILRQKYRAGASTKTERYHTQVEFYNNIKDSDYTLCMRGAGNFSVRFYEVLAMGRIPLYVETNGLLPLEDTVDWKSHVVWVDYKNRENIASILKHFHEGLTDKTFKKLQESNRQLFNEKLSVEGFFFEVYKSRFKDIS